MNRKKKLILIQVSLFVIGMMIIFTTYKDNTRLSKNIFVPKEIKDKINKQKKSKTESGDVFYNIEYTGLDLSGNRYVLQSEEASNDKAEPNIVNMKLVKAIFYFKDNTSLNITSDLGSYNNKTLDMTFNKNVKADYMESKLYANKAEYSNTDSFLTITENVVVKDIKGSIFADKLLFDIKKQTLKIASFNDSKINANINLK
jgi:lipopolysaccharide export system protein LptA